MKNLDTIAQRKGEVIQRVRDAMAAGDETAFQTAFTEWTEYLQEAVLAEASGLIQSNDNAILAGRGVRALTSEETKYYQRVIEAMRSGNPTQALSDMDVVLPKTVIDTIFDDLTSEHPLLNAINFQNTGALIEILVSTSSGVAGWGELTGTIKDELAGSFALIKLGINKLSAFIPVAKAMLDLGPAWLDRFVRAILTEALAAELEAAIVDGDGKDKPIGMTRALTGAVDSVYPRKTAIKITDLDPVTVGSMLNTISKGPNNRRRAVPRILMVVNPADYYTKVYPATTVRTADGSYNTNVLPYPVDAVISPSIPDGHAVFGLAPRYFFGLGTSKGGKIEHSDEYRFLEDQRVYLIKLYGNGRPLDENAFVYADITELKPTVMKVQVIDTEEGTP